MQKIQQRYAEMWAWMFLAAGFILCLLTGLLVGAATYDLTLSVFRDQVTGAHPVAAGDMVIAMMFLPGFGMILGAACSLAVRLTGGQQLCPARMLIAVFGLCTSVYCLAYLFGNNLAWIG
jgi:hypothetical protein